MNGSRFNLWAINRHLGRSLNDGKRDTYQGRADFSFLKTYCGGEKISDKRNCQGRQSSHITYTYLPSSGKNWKRSHDRTNMYIWNVCSHVEGKGEQGGRLFLCRHQLRYPALNYSNSHWKRASGSWLRNTHRGWHVIIPWTQNNSRLTFLPPKDAVKVNDYNAPREEMCSCDIHTALGNLIWLTTLGEGGGSSEKESSNRFSFAFTSDTGIISLAI